MDIFFFFRLVKYPLSCPAWYDIPTSWLLKPSSARRCFMSFVTFPNLFWKSTLDFKSNYKISCFSCCSVRFESINTSCKVVIDSDVCSCSVFGLVNARCHCTGCETIKDFSDCNFADKVMFLPNLKSRSWNVLFSCNLPSQGYRFWWSESKTDSFSFFHLFTIAFKRNPNSGIVELIYVLDEIYTDNIDQKYRTRFFPVSISFRH